MLIGINLIGNAADCRSGQNYPSAMLTRNPAVAKLLISALHRRPSNAMGGLFALLRTSSLVFGSGVVEGCKVDFLGVRWQMRPDWLRKVVD